MALKLPLINVRQPPVPASEGGLRHADERYARQRRARFPWLRFERQLEAEFRAAAPAVNPVRVRIAACIGMLGVLGFLFLDQVLGSNLEPLAADLVLLLVTLPCLLVPVAATFVPRAGPYLLTVLLASTLAMAFSILAVVSLGRLAHPGFPYESLFLVTMYVYFISGLLFYEAMLCGLALWLGFVGSNWTLQPHDVLLYEGYYLFLANVLSWLGLYVLERQGRYAFLLERELRAHAVRDSLTGLLNRRAFRSHLNRAWRQAQRDHQGIGLLLIDIDHFKLINDRFGHPMGDTVLKRVSQLLRANAQRPLDAVGRFGGDEFVAVWFGVDPAWFEGLVRQLPQHLGKLALAPGGPEIAFTVSGGAVLCWPAPGMAVKEAIRMADDTLYEVKRGSRNAIAVARWGEPPAGQAASA